jgi:uncharacterized membrane protein (UPF0127 family)
VRVFLSMTALASTSRAFAAAPQWAVAVLPSGHEYSLEVAADDATRERGYMFREHVGAREGMIFLFDAADRHSFWMKNCRVALDIVWLDAALRIVDIAHDAAPCPERGECPSLLPVEPARYVLELAAGTSEREGLRRGTPLVVLSEPPLR